MTESNELETTTTSWEVYDEADDVDRRKPERKFDSEKYRTTGFFVRSTIAGGVAGCTVNPFVDKF